MDYKLEKPHFWFGRVSPQIKQIYFRALVGQFWAGVGKVNLETHMSEICTIALLVFQVDLMYSFISSFLQCDPSLKDSVKL